MKESITQKPKEGTYLTPPKGGICYEYQRRAGRLFFTAYAFCLCAPTKTFLTDLNKSGADCYTFIPLGGVYWCMVCGTRSGSPAKEARGIEEAVQRAITPFAHIRLDHLPIEGRGRHERTH